MAKTRSLQRKRKDFSKAVKEKLAQRSGYICSYPSCERLTIGPNEEGIHKLGSVGMACHIYSASPGLNAKRTNPNLSDKEVSHISNGIWMCYLHGKLIDTDEVRFTPALLQGWKKINEDISTLRRELGCDYKTAYESLILNKLLENEVVLPKEFAINKAVGDAIHDSCIAIQWGKHLTDNVRDFVIEHIRNSYVHGHATSSILKITSNELLIIDDGSPFDPRNLYARDSCRGGAKSVQVLLNKYQHKIFVSSYRDRNKNILKIAVPDSAECVLELTDCAIDISFDDLHNGNFSYRLMESCREVFIILPEYFALSDINFLSEKHPSLANEKRHLIFVFRRTSDNVQELIKRQFPRSQVLMLEQ